MRAKINNKVYNTQTSRLIGNRFAIQRKCNRVECLLFKKKNGEYFLYCNAYDKTWFHWYDFLTDENAYYEPENHQFFGGGEFIVPLQTEQDVDFYIELAVA